MVRAIDNFIDCGRPTHIFNFTFFRKSYQKQKQFSFSDDRWREILWKLSFGHFLIAWHNKASVKVTDFLDHMVEWQRNEFVHRDVWFGLGNIVEPELVPVEQMPSMSGQGSSVAASSRFEKDAQC